MLVFLGMFLGYLIYIIIFYFVVVRRLIFSFCGSYLVIVLVDCKGMVSCLLIFVKFGYVFVKVYIKCFSCFFLSCKIVVLRKILFDKM